MGSVTLTPYVVGADVTAEGQNANEQLIVNEINGNLDDSNISASAGIQGTKLASKPNGVTTAQINAKAVTSVELANDAAVDANRAVDKDHIKDAAVVYAKIRKLVTTVAFGPGSAGVGAESSVTIDLTTLTQPAGVTLTNPVTGFNVNIPVCVYSKRAGGWAGTDNHISSRLIIDSTTQKIYLVLNNFTNNNGIATLNGYSYDIITFVIA